MLLWLIWNLKFLQIQMVKVLGTEHVGLCHWKVVSFSEGLVQRCILWFSPISFNNTPTVNRF
jgi:hypothetical protein